MLVRYEIKDVRGDNSKQGSSSLSTPTGLPRLKLHTTEEIEKVYVPPKSILVNEFTNDSAKNFRNELANAQRTGQRVVPVVIDSFGGQVYSLLSMMDAISECSIPVATVATGKAMSCGAVLLSCGAPGLRFMSPSATVMIHEVSANAMGKVEELKVDVKEADRLNALIFKRMAANCGYHGDENNWFLNQIHERNHADWFLTGEECLKNMIVNHLRTPSFKVCISTEETFG